MRVLGQEREILVKDKFTEDELAYCTHATLIGLLQQKQDGLRCGRRFDIFVK
jgi:hypothetical protein